MTFFVGILLGAIVGAMAVLIAWVRDEQQRSLHRLGMRNRHQGPDDPGVGRT